MSPTVSAVIMVVLFILTGRRQLAHPAVRSFKAICEVIHHQHLAKVSNLKPTELYREVGWRQLDSPVVVSEVSAYESHGNIPPSGGTHVS